MGESKSDNGLLMLTAADVQASLPYDACIAVVRQAMIAHSSGETRHLLRSFIGMGEGRTFAQMSAALAIDGYFGAKLVSVFADPADPAHRAHCGVVVLFEGKSGHPVCLGDAGAVAIFELQASTGRQPAVHIDAEVLIDSMR